MKTTLAALILLSVVALQAEEIALWTEKLPGFRKEADVSVLPERLFGIKTQFTAEKTDEDANVKLAEAVNKVGGLTVAGLIWSNTPSDRRVLMGDIVLREGQAIPSYVFKDGRYYTLVQIFQNRLSFKAQESDFGEPLMFDIPFNFTQSVKNQSSFSTDAKK